MGNDGEKREKAAFHSDPAVRSSSGDVNGDCSGHLMDPVCAGYSPSQLIQGGVCSEAVVEHYHVSPGSIIGQDSRAALCQRSIRRIQRLRRIKDLLVGAVILHLNGERCCG